MAHLDDAIRRRDLESQMAGCPLPPDARRELREKQALWHDLARDLHNAEREIGRLQAN
jgi:hypothetical protein